MKRAVILLLIVASSASFAQQTSTDLQKQIPQPFIDKIEVVVGPSLNIPNDHGWAEYVKSWSGGPFTDVVKNKVGYFVGLGLTHTMGKRFELTARVLYDRKGYKQESASQYSQTKIDYRYDYFTFAVQPRLQLGKAKKFHVFAGGAFGLLTQSKFEEMFFDNGKLVNINLSPYNDYAKKYEANICIGLGHSFKLNTSKSLLFQFQCNYGLLDITTFNNFRLTSQSFCFSIAYRHNREIYSNQLNK